MEDMISRKAAIDAIFSEPLYKSGMKKRDAEEVVPAIFEKIKSLPTAQPETHEERTHAFPCDLISRSWCINSWCIDCKEYDTKNKCCPRYNRVIKQTLDDAYRHGETEAEARFHGEIVRCKECKYWMPHSQLGFDEDNGTYHDYCAKLVPEDEYYAFYRNADDYCSRAERKTDE